MVSYVYRDGARLTPWMDYCLGRLDADLQRLFGVRLTLAPDKGIRTTAEQTAIFLSRYRVQLVGKGPFGDVRWWKGRRYVRHSGLGTVAQPGTSNHEIQGSTAAVDVADSGGPGIGTMGSARSNWLRANASRYGLVPEGFSFGEAWHYAIPNVFNPVPGVGSGAGSSAGSGGSGVVPPGRVEEDEDDMYIANVKNGNFYLVIGKQAHALGGASGARESGIPVINYPDDWAVKQLKAGGVTGIG